METRNGVENKGDFCFLANIKTFLDKFGVQQEEYWLGGIAGVMGFYFTTLKTGIPSVIHGRSEEFEGLYAHFVKYFKEPLKTERFSQKCKALDQVSTLLKSGITTMMWMDEYYFPKTYNYQKNHLWVMNVIQKDLGSELEIFDNEELIVSKEEMEHLLLRDGIIEIQYAPSGRIEWKYSEKKMVKKGLENVLKNLRKTSNLPEQYFGIEGMNQYKAVFSTCQDYKEIYNYFYEMNRGGGLYKTRRNMNLFLQEIEQRWPCEEAKSCVSHYADLEEKWTKITNLTFKLSVCKDLALQKRIEKRLENAIILEEQGAVRIEKLINVLF